MIGEKRGSGDYWFFVVFIVVIGLIVNLMIVYFYFPSEERVVNMIESSESEIESLIDSELSGKADRPGCKYVEVDVDVDSSRTDNEICSEFSKEPILRVLYVEKSAFKGEPGAVATTDFCDSERLVYLGEESYVSRTNIGQQIGYSSFGNSGCKVIDSEAGYAEIVDTTGLGIICC